MKKEIRIFLNALAFFTRIPVNTHKIYSEENESKSLKYLPLIGWIAGGLSALFFYVSTLILPISVSIIFSMLASILLTGAFHEDGLADVCDGFGGGRTVEEKLNIMKDSHIGVFGVIGLIMILGLKFCLLYEICIIYETIIPVVIISAHSLSRFAAVSIMFTNTYVRKEQSKIITVTKKISFSDFCFAAVFGFLPVLLFYFSYKHNYQFILLIIPVVVTIWILGKYFKRQIGGYTGDCLGATQQICEVMFYISLLILWKYI